MIYHITTHCWLHSNCKIFKLLHRLHVNFDLLITIFHNKLLQLDDIFSFDMSMTCKNDTFIQLLHKIDFYLDNVITANGFRTTYPLLIFQLQECLWQYVLYVLSHFKQVSGLSLLQCGRQYKNKQMVIQEDKCPVPTEYPKSNFL